MSGKHVSLSHGKINQIICLDVATAEANGWAQFNRQASQSHMSRKVDITSSKLKNDDNPVPNIQSTITTW